MFEGPPGAPPVVLLHGFTASSASFVENIEGLRKHFTVVAVELLGHGDSDAPDDPAPYRPEVATARLRGLFDALGFGEVLLCGHSLGGALALRFALEHPERTAGVVVINSNSAAGDAAWRAEARANLAALAERVRAFGTEFLKSTRLYPARSRRLPERAKRALTEDFDRLTPPGVAHTATELVANIDVLERLGGLRSPVLVVIGDRDAEFVEHAPRLLKSLPRGLARAVTLEGAGHAANLEAPREFERAVVQFAEEIGYLPRERRDERANTVLTLLGGLLVAGGLALIGASFLSGGGDRSLPAIGSEEPAGASPTIRVAGERTPGSGWSTSATPSPTFAPRAGATAAATGSPSPTANGRDVSPTTSPPPATATLVPPSPTPSATPTPSEPVARVVGPTSAAVGEPVTVTNASTVPGGALFRVEWSATGGSFGEAQPGWATLVFPEPGCYTVFLQLVFADGRQLAASHSLAVGGAACE